MIMYVCSQCGKEIEWFDGYWAHVDKEELAACINTWVANSYKDGRSKRTRDNYFFCARRAKVIIKESIEDKRQLVVHKGRTAS